jgi:hypothetical protein
MNLLELVKHKITEQATNYHIISETSLKKTDMYLINKDTLKMIYQIKLYATTSSIHIECITDHTVEYSATINELPKLIPLFQSIR